MRLAAFSQPSGNPGLAAITSQGRLFVSLAAGPADWGPWQELDKPPGSAAVRDLDALEGGDAELYVVTSDGRAFRRRLQGSSWGKWVSLRGSGFERISAVRRSTGQRLVFLGDAAHDVWVSRQSGTGWITGFKQPLSFRGGMPFTLIDFDAVRGSDGLVQFFGVDGATGTLWTRREESKLANEFKWASWQKWNVRLFVTDESFKATASQAALKYGFWQETAGPALDEVATIAATRWPESDKIVVFATDDGGNVYSTEPRCASSTAASCYWAGWRSFAE
jgi:hypothetical protein